MSLSRCRTCTLYHYDGTRCPGPAELRWPLGPLQDALGGSVRSLMRHTGVSGADIARAALDGLSDRQADRWACRAGLHPANVWPDWDLAALTVLDDVFINHGGWRAAWLTTLPDHTRSNAA